jgi:hypothetical protein
MGIPTSIQGAQNTAIDKVKAALPKVRLPF